MEWRTSIDILESLSLLDKSKPEETKSANIEPVPQIDFEKAYNVPVDPKYFSRKVEASMSSTTPLPNVSLPSAFLHGASAGLAGEEPTNYWGQGADLLGMVGFFAATGALTGGAADFAGLGIGAAERLTYESLYALGRGGVMGASDTGLLSTAARIGMESGAGIVRGVTEGQEYYGIKGDVITPESAAMWGLLGGLPIHELFGGMAGRFKKITQKDLGLSDVEPSTKAPEEILKANNIKVASDETIARQRTEETFNPNQGYRTPLEGSMTKVSDLADKYKARKLEATAELQKAQEDFRWGKDVKPDEHIAKGQERTNLVTDKFIKQDLGGYITTPEIKLVFKAMKDRELRGFVDEHDVLNKIEDMRLSGDIEVDPLVTPKTRTPEQTDIMVRQLTRNLDNIERATYLGLEPHASASSIESRVTELADHTVKLEEKYAHDTKAHAILDEAINAIDETVKNRPYGVSMDFVNSPRVQRFAQALDEFASSKELLVRTGEAEKIIEEVTKNAQKMGTRLNESLRKAGEKDIIAYQEANQLLAHVASGKKIEGKSFPAMRASLAKKAIDELDKSIPEEWINPEIAKQLGDLREEQRTLGTRQIAPDEFIAKTKGIDLKKEQLKQQLAYSFFADPNMARALADKSGNADLSQALDMYYASLGDPISRAKLNWKNQSGIWQTPIDISNNKILLSPHEQVETKDWTGVEEPTLVKPSIKDEGIPGTPSIPPDEGKNFQEFIASIDNGKDLSPWARLLGTFQATAQRWSRNAKTPRLKQMYTMVSDWADELSRRYNAVNNNIDEFKSGVFTDWNNYIDSLGKDSNYARKFPDEMAKLANTLIDQKLELGSTREETYAEVKSILDQKVAVQSPAIREAMRRFQSMEQWVFDKGNEGVARVNERIDRGEITGDKLDLTTYRPYRGGLFTYPGDFILEHIEPDGFRRTIGYVYNNDEAAKVVTKYFKDHGDNVQGTIVKRPKLFDDYSQILKMEDYGVNLDQAFGERADAIKKLMDTGGFTKDRINDVFYGARKMRSLGLDEFKLETNQAMLIDAMAATRFAHYSDMTIEGRNLAKILADNGLKNWSAAVISRGNAMLGMSTGLEKTLDFHLQATANWLIKEFPPTAKLMQALGIRPNGRIMRSTVGMLTTMGRVVGLGGNVGAALGNVLQIPILLAPTLGFENVTKAVMGLRQAMKDPAIAKIFRDERINVKTPENNLGQAPIFHAELERRGTKVIHAIDTLSMSLFNPTESYTKGIGAVSAYNMAGKLAQKLSKYGDDGTWQMKEWIDSKRIAKNDPVRAKEVFVNRMIKKVVFNFDTANLSEMAINPTTRLAFQFQSWNMKMIELLSGQSVPLTAKERFLVLGMTTMIGGAFALPFVDDLDMVGRQFGVSPKLWMEAYLGDTLTGGLLAGAGVNITQNVNWGRFSGFANINPAGVAMTSAYRYYNNIKNGGDTAASIASMSHGTKMVYDAYKLLSEGRLVDTRGNTTITADQMTGLGEAARVLGIKTTPEAQLEIYRAAAQSMASNMKREKHNALEDIVSSQASGDGEKASEIMHEQGITSKMVRDYKKRKSMSGIDRRKQQLPQSLRDSQTFQRVYDKIQP